MPAEHHDSRTSERIEAFLDGPPRPARRRRSGLRRPRRPLVLETTLEWREAVRREEIRVGRYGRPATIMVVDIAAGVESGGSSIHSDELVELVLGAIRQEARETDHVVRTSATRFHLLLPETGELDADHVAERLRAACGEGLSGHGGALLLRLETMTPGHGASLIDAVHATERRLAG
jgi:GGDEF domain-containing protein